MIEAVDTLKLLKEINKQALKNNRIINVLLELHIAEEESKYGFTFDDCRKLLGRRWMEAAEKCSYIGIDDDGFQYDG